MREADRITLDVLKAAAPTADPVLWAALEQQVAEVGVAGLTGSGQAFVEALVRKHMEPGDKGYASAHPNSKQGGGGGGAAAGGGDDAKPAKPALQSKRISSGEFEALRDAREVKEGDRVWEEHNIRDEPDGRKSVAISSGTVTGVGERSIGIKYDDGSTGSNDYWHLMKAPSWEKDKKYG